jgi:hypothetical protein
MNKLSLCVAAAALSAGAAGVIVAVAGVAPAAQTAPAATRPASPTPRVVAAANAFLATLNDAQRSRVLFRFDDREQRARWSNFPVTFVPRGGLSLQELNDAQRGAAMSLVAAALSDRGFEKVRQIMQGDEVLKTQPGGGPGGRGGGPGGRGRRGPGGPNGGPGGGSEFGKDLYYLSILGTPSETEPWMLQFGGHHLALNVTIVGARGVLTPSLTAAQPALYEFEGRTVRPLAGESDKAFALLDSLTPDQRKAAVLNYRVADLVLGPGRDGQTIQPEGLKVATLDDKQKRLLLDLVAEWAGIANDGYASARMEEVAAGLDDTWFAWSGATTHEPGKGGTGYYRIQGPKLVIEYAPQGMGGDPTLHVHTIYRDPTNDYGRALVAK